MSLLVRALSGLTEIGQLDYYYLWTTFTDNVHIVSNDVLSVWERRVM